MTQFPTNPYSKPAISIVASPTKRNAILELAQKAEQLGFEGLACPSLGGTMALCTSLAHATSTIHFWTSIQPMYYSHPVETANTAAHQEKWDGSGYPEGLAGEAIPVSARLMALADVYDAIISRRVYKEGMSHASAVHIITQGRGQHFDPDIVDAFLAILDEFQDIAARYADSDADLQKKQDYLEIATFNQRANT